MIKFTKNHAAHVEKFRARGFTLLEILVALAIFALISVVCYRQIDASFRAATRIEQKYLALWMAESAIEELFVDRVWPQTGEKTSEYQISDTRWLIKTNISETKIKTLRQVEVSVYPDARDTEHAVLTLTRFIGEN